MTKKIIITLTFLLLSFSAFSEPEVPADVNEKDEVTTYESTQDLMNRFVLAFFGKDALRAFTPYEITDLEEAVIEDYIHPLPNFYRFLGFAFVFASLISFILALFYLSYIIYDGLFKSQKSGEILGSNWNRVFLLLKVVIAISLTYPFVGSNGIGYNGSQYLIFYAFGKSKEAGDSIVRDFNNNNISSYPEIPIPEFYGSAYEITDEMLDFVICLNKNSYEHPTGKRALKIRNNINVSGDLSITAYNRQCGFRMSFPLNSGLQTKIENNQEINEFFENNYSLNGEIFEEEGGGYYNYLSAKIDSYNLIFDELLKKASIVGNAYMISMREKNPNNLQLALSDFEFDNYIVGDNNIENRNWMGMCPMFYDELKGLEKLNDFEAAFIRRFGAYCLSYELMRHTVLPKNENKKDNLLKTRNNFDILCSDRIEDAIGSDIEIMQCVRDTCSDLSSLSNNDYYCSNAVNLYDYQEYATRYDNLGFLVFGATIYNKFGNFNSTGSKILLNNVNTGAVSSFNPFKGTKSKSGTNYTLREINIETGAENYFQYRRIDPDDRVNNIQFEYDFSQQIENVKSDGYSITHPMQRLQKCVSNPISITDQYVCDSVIQEINKFGLNTIDIFTSYYVAKTTGSIIRSQGRITSVRRAQQGNLNRFINMVSNSKPMQLVLGGALVKGITEIISISGEQDDNDSRVAGDMFTTNNSTFMGTMGYNLASAHSSSYGIPLIGYFQGYAGVNSKVITFFMVSFLLSGLIMAFMIPLIPFWVFTMAAINILSLFIMKVFSFGFLAAFIMKPSQDYSSDVVNKFMGTIFEILFKIPFLVIGLVLSWLLTNTFVSKIFLIFDFDNLFFTTDIMGLNEIVQLLFTVVYSIVYLIIFWKFTALTLGLIDNFEEMSMSLVRGTSYKFGGTDKVSGVFSETKSYFYYGSRMKTKMDMANRNAENDYDGTNRAKRSLFNDMRKGFKGNKDESGGNNE